MYNEEFETIGLYDHNANSYKRVKKAYESGEDIVGIIHATGTGKSYNALQLAYDNKDKKIVYVVPSNAIVEHIKQIIDDNPNLDIERDFPNLEFRTYQSFVNLSEEEIENIPCDLLILDEFHHIGAPVWGARINTMIETHPNMKIFGMTAYTVRDRGTSYERDMANADTDELFSNKIVSRYDLCDAMIDGVLPKPIYRSAYIKLLDLEEELEKRVQKLNQSSQEYKELMAILSDVKRRIHEAPSIPNILRKSIKPNGKYIYFCPPCSEEGTNDIETIKKQAIEWFKQFVPEEDIIIYTSTSDMGEDGKLNRDAFYDDITLDGEKADNKLRVMFAINQYNEGIHAPNIDGVIMGRGTTSDIVYFEQLGRALSVRGNTKEMFNELEKYSVEKLLEMCKSRDIAVKENTSKEELIEKLIAPVVIDLTNNYEFIKELENNLRDRIKDIQTNGLGSRRDIKIRDASFDIEIENQDLFEMLRYVSDRLTMTWEDYYELAKAYYEHNGDLEIPDKFKTNDGFTYDENGIINLGDWISRQRMYTNPESERGQLLLRIGMSFEDQRDIKWKRNYKYAFQYYKEHGDLDVPQEFKIIEGNNIVNLGNWIKTQRKTVNPKSERGQLLLQIGMRFNKKRLSWEEMYELAKKYFEENHNLDIPERFETNDGYALGQWIQTQRREVSLESEKGQLLLQIGMNFGNQFDDKWNVMFEYAKLYYQENGNLEIPVSFKTNDGIHSSKNGKINLGQWIVNQRKTVDPKSERGQLLIGIGMRFENKRIIIPWEEMYEFAKKYFDVYHHLHIPQSYITSNGYDYDKKGNIKLGKWIMTQRRLMLMIK